MGVIHDLAAHAGSGLRGIQATQRDWSPFVGHFTSYRAMETLRHAATPGTSPEEVARLLSVADCKSAEVVASIAKSHILRPSSPSPPDGIPACVCLSECCLPGLLGHCEQFGRFGFMFRKSALFALGARPCAYVDREGYGEIAKLGRPPATTNAAIGKLFGLANVYAPPGHGRIQDFTHQREWRLFADLDLTASSPEMIVAPRSYIQRVRCWFPQVDIVIPIDTLHEWGL